MGHAGAGGAAVVRALVALVLCALAGTALAAPAGAQLYFGQNLVQYDRLDWRVLETEHFLVHYYPVEKEAAVDAARMAERSYARLSRLLQHQFREKKPIILYASRGDFAQSNVFGDLGEGTGGVTDPLRQRMAQPFTGDYKSFEHVLMHEMVHQFQFDIFSRGRAGANLQVLSQVNPPLWFMEGMAEFLSLGHRHPQTDAWIRDAALNGTLPTIRQMTERPYQYFPYRYGFALWQYVATRWGDEVVGEIMNAVPSLGVERAFKRETGLTLDELSEEWKEAMQLRHLPRVAEYDRVRRFATPLLTQRRTGGFADLFIAPSLSPDGRYVAFISYGNFLRGEVFPELYLADARTGKRIKRLVHSGNNAQAEELRQLYSQSAFSPDGRLLAYTAQQKGRDQLFLLDVATRRTVRRFALPLEAVLGPTWSPDGKRLAFTGNVGGITDLYVVDADGRNFRQLTRDRYADMQPHWSPDGRSLAFATDRGTDFEVLRLGQWQIAVYDLASGRVAVVPRQAGLNINPQWAPDGRSIAYVSDRTGIANVFLWDTDAGEHYQLTNVIGAVNSATEYSPALTWARGTDVLAFTYYEKGTNNVWQVRDPRSLKREPYRERAAPPTVAVAPSVGVAAAPEAGGTAVRTAAGIAAYTVPAPRAADSARVGFVAADPPRRDSLGDRVAARSWYRTPDHQVRPSADGIGARSLGIEPLSVTALLDSAALALPDPERFRDAPYRAGFQPEYIAQPQVGVGMASNYGQALYGGTTIVLSDLLGNQQLAIAGGVNGTIQDAQVYVGYTSLARRLQYTTGVSQLPLYFVGSGGSETRTDGSTVWSDNVVRFAYRDAFWRALYPLDRFTRFELGGRLTNVGRSLIPFTSTFDAGGALVGQQRGRAQGLGSATMVAPSLAFVRDDALFGYTSPIMGSRLRFSVEPQVGTWRWVDYVLDYRRYDPVLFNFLTIATRVSASLTAGRDEGQVPKYIGRPDLVRGYNRDPIAQGCGSPAATERLCAGQQLLGSRVAFMNAEVRFPVVRRFDLGVLPITLPPVDGLVFYDMGVAWTGQSRDGQATQRLLARRPATYDLTQQRYPLRSYGYGIRFNLFGFMIVRWDYAWPLDGPNRRAYGTWFVGPSF